MLLSLQYHCVVSQQYPVQVTTTITPPYSVYLSDYISPESNNFHVLINLLELDRTNLRVKLKVTIEGAGILLQTNPSYVPPAIVLQGGVPELLTGFDLRSYFNPDNLIFSGITKSKFVQEGKLPEGFYTFAIEVVEISRNVRVSNQSMANAWVVLNDPPLINLPFNGDKIIASDPQNILFSWTPRHTASPNAAFTTGYEFRLAEMYPGQTNPDAAIRSSNSLFTLTTPQTSLNYGIIEPTLIPGRKYVFRIRAFDTTGKDLFKNEGYSETYVFQYGDACLLPTQIRAEVLDHHRARIEWEPTLGHSGFQLQYRKAGNDRWYQKESISSSVLIPELSGSTTYEYRVEPQCGTILGDASPLYTFTTPEINENAFVCGAPVPEFNMNTAPLLKPLLPLDVIHIGDWDVNVNSIHANGDGTYAGTGYAAVPYLNLANVRVTWDRILVNEDYRVLAGNIRTVYSTESRFVMELERKEEVVEDEIEEPAEELEIIIEEPMEIPAEEVVMEVSADIATVEVVDGALVVFDELGNPVTLDETPLPAEGQELILTDINGDTWVVDGEGGITEKNSENEPIDIEPQPGQALIVINEKSYQHNQTVYLKKGGIFSFATENTETDSIQWTIMNQDGIDISSFEDDIDFDQKNLDLPSNSIYHYIKIRALYNNLRTDLNVYAYELGNFRFEKESLQHGTRDSVKIDFYTNIEDKTNIKVTLMSNLDTLNYNLDDIIYWYNFDSVKFYSVGNYKLDLKFTYQDANLSQTSKNIKVESKYVIVVKDSVTSAATQAVTYGTSFVGNSTTAACNICTRAAVYISTGKGNKLLYPINGSHLGDTSTVYLKGEITDPGKANDIYDDLKDNKVVRYEYIPDMKDEDYPDFEKLQSDSNTGQIIVGTYRNTGSGSGHVVMIVPGIASEHSDEARFTLSDEVTQIKLPKILECGSNHRESQTTISDNMSESIVKQLRWYKLTSTK